MKKFVEVEKSIFARVNEENEQIDYMFVVKGHKIVKLGVLSDVKTFVLPTLQDIDPGRKSIKIEKLCKYFSGRPIKKMLAQDIDGAPERLFGKYLCGELDVAENCFDAVENPTIIVPNKNSYRFFYKKDLSNINLKLAKNFRLYKLINLNEGQDYTNVVLVANHCIWNRDAMALADKLYQHYYQQPLPPHPQYANANISFYEDDEWD